MRQNPFFIELSSNSRSYEHINTVANFKNSIVIDPLEGEWEMALVEISYMKTWKNLINSLDVCLTLKQQIEKIVSKSKGVKRSVDPKSLKVKTTPNEHKQTKRAPIGSILNILPSPIPIGGILEVAKKPNRPQPKAPPSQAIKPEPKKPIETVESEEPIVETKPFCRTIKPGFYDSINSLIEEVNNNIKTVSDDSQVMSYPPNFSYNEHTKIVTLAPGRDNKGNFIVPILNNEVYEILGLINYDHKSPRYTTGTTIEGERPAQLNATLHTIYVYCDIIEPQFIADTRARLLRTVEIPDDAKFGSTINIKYDNPHYVPIIVNDFEYIEIDLKDDTNERIPFLYGRTRVKLHIRRRNVE